MKGFLELGKVVGIKIQIHWTFALLLLWIGFVEFENSGDLEKVVMSQGIILALMLCVVLHELGHALAARKFNVKTNKIILLPIGGVASLEKMPENPVHELIIAFAGLLVNMVIALILALIVPIRSYFNFDSLVINEQLYEPTFQNFLFYLFIANVMLVLFNLIPAFPMDGGRVLKALLSFKLGHVRATKVASSIGQGFAILFFVLGLFYNPILVLIAFFIFFGAYSENQIVQQGSLLAGHFAKEATLTDITLLNPNTKVQEVIAIILKGTERDFIVMENEEVVGIIHQKDIVKNAVTPLIPVGELMGKPTRPVAANTSLNEVLERMREERSDFFPVTEDGKFVGAIDRLNISEFILLKSSVR